MSPGTILQGLNDSQYEAVTADPTCPLQIVAGPGTGKTTVLASRVAYLLVEKKIPPQSVLVTTFTKKAAKEMTERIMDLLKPYPEIPVSTLFIGTFHSVCIRLLRRFCDKVGLGPNFKVVDEMDAKSILRQITPTLESRVRDEIRKKISMLKAHGLYSRSFSSPQEKDKETLRIYSEYQEYLETNSLLDFDDLLLYGSRLVSSNSTCLNFLRHVLVDEFQDTNKIQLTLMIDLARKAGNCVTVVGDPDQSIYGFRNADYTNFAQMEAHYKGLPDGRFRRVMLTLNYRSTSAIIEASEQVLESHTAPRPQRKLKAISNLKMPVVYLENHKNTDEAKKLASTMRTLKAMEGLFSYADFAILLRTRLQSRVIEQELMKQGIPYHLDRGYDFWGLKIVRTMLDYLRVVHSDKDVLALSRTVNYPPRKVGEVTLNQLLVKLNEEPSITKALQAYRPPKPGIQAYLELIKGCRQECINADKECVLKVYDVIAEKTEIAKYIDEEKKKRLKRDLLDEERADQLLADLRSQIEDFIPSEEALDELKVDTNPSFFGAFLDSIAFYQSNKAESVDSVTISTIHAAKGLEWPVVFVPGISEGIFPSMKSSSILNNPSTEPDSEEDLITDLSTHDNDEDVRCLFVATTRAKKILVLSSFESWNLSTDRLRPSPYLKKLMNLDKTMDTIDKDNRKALYELMGKPYQPPRQSEVTRSLTSSSSFTAASFTTASAALGLPPAEPRKGTKKGGFGTFSAPNTSASVSLASAMKPEIPHFVPHATTGIPTVKKRRLGMRRPTHQSK